MPWAFRGHADESWPLLPSAWRLGNPIIEAGKREAADRFARSKPEPQLRWIFHPNNFNTGELRFGDNDAALARQLVQDSESSDSIAQMALQDRREDGLDRMPTQNESLTFAQTVLVIDANAELLPLWDFARRCDDHGLNTPMGSVTDLDVHTDWLHVPSVPLIADGSKYIATRTRKSSGIHANARQHLSGRASPLVASIGKLKSLMPATSWRSVRHCAWQCGKASNEHLRHHHRGNRCLR